MKNRIWSLILVVVLLATIGLTAVGCDATDPWAEPAYFSDLYVYNGTAWVQVTGSGGGGGGGGLWEVDGAETQLIIADDIDMQTKKIINVVDPVANQDAATKKYVDDNAGLWEIDGTETQLIIADDIDIQNQSLINVLYINGVSVVTLNATVEGHTTQVVGLINNVTALQLLSHAQNTDTGLGVLGVKNPPIDADKVIYRDSTAGDALVTSTWTQVKAFLKTYFDTIYFTNSTVLDDLADVSVAGPADDTFLYYDLATGLWKSRALADADIPAAIARDAEVDADIAAHNTSTTYVHGVTGTVLGTEDVDDVAVDGAATAPISSNWAYDHANNGSIHTTITTAAIDLYVDAGAGNDANDGSSGSPKATIQGALDALPVVIAHACTINVRGQQNYAESNVALEFSRFDTLAAITIKAVNANDENMYDNGQADAGAGNNELDDATKSWSVDQFNGAYVWIYEGTGAGQIRAISDTTATKLTTTVNWATNPDATSYYVIGGGATMTGTDSYHVSISSKKVNIYGFKHTGATTADGVVSDFGSSLWRYNYNHTSVEGLRTVGTTTGWAQYNYSSASAKGILIQEFGLWRVRANVCEGATDGLVALSYGIMFMLSSAGNKNYLLNCTRGIRVSTGSGCLYASGQVFSGCVTNIDPAASTTIPRWYT